MTGIPGGKIQPFSPKVMMWNTCKRALQQTTIKTRSFWRGTQNWKRCPWGVSGKCDVFLFFVNVGFYYTVPYGKSMSLSPLRDIYVFVSLFIFCKPTFLELNSNSYSARKKTGGHATSWILDSVGGMYPTRWMGTPRVFQGKGMANLVLRIESGVNNVILCTYLIYFHNELLHLTHLVCQLSK